jgi:hypothetical protein
MSISYKTYSLPTFKVSVAYAQLCFSFEFLPCSF